MEKLGAKSNLNLGFKRSENITTSIPGLKAAENFLNESENGILIINVNLKKAVLNYSKPFLEHLLNSINSGQQKIIVDLSNCNIIDSTFLGVLVKSHKTIQHKNGEDALIYFGDRK